MAKTWTVEEVMELFTATVTDTMAVSAKGQAHLNRIAKAITNESLEQRKATSYQTYAQKAFDKKVSEYVATKSTKLDEFVAGKEEWIKAYIAKHYESDED
jgi:hypothetical protein